MTGMSSSFSLGAHHPSSRHASHWSVLALAVARGLVNVICMETKVLHFSTWVLAEGQQTGQVQRAKTKQLCEAVEIMEIWSRVKRKAQCPSSKLEPIITSFCRITNGPFASCDSRMDCCPYAPGGADPWEGLDGPIPRNSLGGEAAMDNLGN